MAGRARVTKWQIKAWRWPWAALIAALFVLAIDRCALGPDGPWDRLQLSEGASHHSVGVASDRRLLAELRRSDEPAEAPLFVVGSSRAQRAIDAGMEATGHRWVKLTHLLIGPVEIRCAVEDLVAHAPAAVVLPLSEFDTHGTVLFDELRPGASFRNWPCFVALMAETGPRLVFERRDRFLQFAAASLLRLYQLRELLQDAGFERLRGFSEEGRRVRRPHRIEYESLSDLAAEIRQDPDLREMIRSLNQRFRGRSSIIHRGQFRLVREIRDGDHARIQMGMVVRAVERLRDAGIDVLIAEAPLYVGSYSLYDTALRAEFLAMAQLLARQEGVDFLPLEEQPAYEKDDFGDLTHMNKRGSKKFTAAVVERVRATSKERPAGT